MPSPSTPPALRRGRPKKYGKPARAITLTLPEDVLALLGGVDADVGRAIVKLAERHTTGAARAVRPAEVTSYGSHAVIVVTPVRALRRFPGVQLVPIGDGRSLIALEPPYSVPQFELDLRDALVGKDLRHAERETLAACADILRAARASRQIRPRERTIIVLEHRAGGGRKKGAR